MVNKISLEKKWKIIVIIYSIILIALLSMTIVLFCKPNKVYVASDIGILKTIGIHTEKIEITMPDGKEFMLDDNEKIAKLGKAIDSSVYILSKRSIKLDGLPIFIKICNGSETKDIQIYNQGIRYGSKYYKTSIDFHDTIQELIENPAT